MTADSTLRAQRMAQALASAAIEGHVPTPEFLADVDRFIAGEMTIDQMRAESLKRALAADRAATAAKAREDATRVF